MTTKGVKLVVFVPRSHEEVVLKAMGDAGAGRIGNYSHCSFSTSGIGRYVPKVGANPTIGAVGKLEKVEEIKIETVCELGLVSDVIKAVKKVHPYEEAPFDVFPLLEIDKL